jgi:hypothetical protein
MKKRHIWMSLALFLVYGALLYAVNLSKPTQGIGVPGASDSSLPTGTMALSRLWTKLGMEFTVWAKPPYFLDNQEHRTFVSVSPDASVYNDKAVNALLGWVRQGHQVIWITNHDDKLLSSLHLDISDGPTAHLTQLWVKQSDGGQEPIRNLDVESAARLSGSGLKQASTTYRATNGDVLGVRLAYGRGAVTVWTAPSVWENGTIGKGENLQIPWLLSEHHDVLFDEYGHGVVSGGMLATTFGHGREMSLWLFILALILYAWLGATRFGRPVPHVMEGPRLSTEFLDAFAWHLRQSRLYEGSLSLLRAAVLRRLEALLPGAREMSTTELKVKVSRQFPADVTERFAAFQQAVEQNDGLDKRRWREALKTIYDFLQVLRRYESVTSHESVEGEEHQRLG